MAADIVPVLYDKIQAAFEQNMKTSKRIKNFLSRDEHTAKEVSLYAAELGRCASEALGSCLTEEELPNGKLYWNIAKRTVLPLLRNAYDLVMDAAEKMQRQQDLKIGIQIAPIRPEFPADRIRDLLDKLIEYQEDEGGK